MVAGGWATLLIFYRVFSRPAGHGYPVGIQWGFFLAFVAAGTLTYAGWRMRATSTPEPPLRRTRTRARKSPPEEDITVVAPEKDITVVVPSPKRVERGASAHAPNPQPPTSTTQRQERKRPRFPPKPSDQLSFEDQPYHSPDDA
jgi:hypothetical protein